MYHRKVMAGSRSCHKAVPDSVCEWNYTIRFKEDYAYDINASS